MQADSHHHYATTSLCWRTHRPLPTQRVRILNFQNAISRNNWDSGSCHSGVITYSYRTFGTANFVQKAEGRLTHSPCEPFLFSGSKTKINWLIWWTLKKLEESVFRYLRHGYRKFGQRIWCSSDISGVYYKYEPNSKVLAFFIYGHFDYIILLMQNDVTTFTIGFRQILNLLRDFKAEWSSSESATKF